MRPSGTTAVASVSSRPAPDWDSVPQCCTCQSLARPSLLAYWHMGATTMRLASVSGPNETGVNNRAMADLQQTIADYVLHGGDASSTPAEHSLAGTAQAAGALCSAINSTPAATSAMPSHSCTAGRSPSSAYAKTATSTTLSLSMGATCDACPSCSARK